MGPELKVVKKYYNSETQAVRSRSGFGKNPSGFRKEGKGSRMRWGYGKSKEEMRRVHSGGHARCEEGCGFDSHVKIEWQDLVHWE